MSEKILIKNCYVVPMKEGSPPSKRYFKGEIAIEGSTIFDIGESIPLDTFKPDKIIDAEDMVALPGFINCHTHAAMTLLRSYTDDLPLMEWLQEKIWPIEAKFTASDIYWGTKLAVLEMIKSGTTTFADMYSFMDEVAAVVEESGMRASLSRGMIEFNNGEEALVEAKNLAKNWHNKADGRITVMLAPHAPYTCSPKFLEKVVREAQDLNVGIHIHVSETLQEIAEIREKYDKTPVEYLNDIGVLDVHTLAAHCVHLNTKDIEILAEKNVKVVHNPESNMKLASGIAPVPKLLDKGVCVALGTDGASSNNNLDMISEMRSASFLHKVNTMEPTTLNAYDTLKLATVNGAKALGLHEMIGQLEKGKKADIILINLKKAHLKPLNDIIANLVYSANSSDVETVIIDGKIVMENRKVLTLDEEEIYKEVEACIKRVTN